MTAVGLELLFGVTVGAGVAAGVTAVGPESMQSGEGSRNCQWIAVLRGSFGSCSKTIVFPAA